MAGSANKSLKVFSSRKSMLDNFYTTHFIATEWGYNEILRKIVRDWKLDNEIKIKIERQIERM